MVGIHTVVVVAVVVQGVEPGKRRIQAVVVEGIVVVVVEVVAVGMEPQDKLAVVAAVAVGTLVEVVVDRMPEVVVAVVDRLGQQRVGRSSVPLTLLPLSSPFVLCLLLLFFSFFFLFLILSGWRSRHKQQHQGPTK